MRGMAAYLRHFPGMGLCV